MNNTRTDRPDDGLNRAIADLDWDIEPANDLWPQVESTIRFRAKKPQHRNYWPPMALAASVLLAVSAIIFSFTSWQRVDQMKEMQASMALFQQSHISLIEQQHNLVRAQLTAVLAQGPDHIDPQLATEITAVLKSIDSASLEIKKAIEVQPFDSSYASMLARTYQRETRLLNQLTSSDNRSNDSTSI